MRTRLIKKTKINMAKKTLAEVERFFKGDWFKTIMPDLDGVKAFEALKNTYETEVRASKMETFMKTRSQIDIVRCKDCKHWRNTDAEKIPTASIACGNMHADDYCSYGEREGE